MIPRDDKQIDSQLLGIQENIWQYWLYEEPEVTAVVVSNLLLNTGDDLLLNQGGYLLLNH